MCILNSPPIEQALSFFSPRIFVPIIICILCSSVNLFALYKVSEQDTYSLTRDDIPNLRRPSQFIGLEKVKSLKPAPIIPRHLVNYPMVLAPTDHREPGKVFPQDPKAFKAVQGMASAEERRFLVSRTVRSDYILCSGCCYTRIYLDLNHSAIPCARLRNGELLVDDNISFI